MKSKTINVKTKKTIERRFGLFNLVNSILIFLTVPGILFVLFLIVKNYQYFTSRISILYPIIHFSLFLSKYLFFHIFNYELLKDMNTRKIGKYNKNRIIKLCDEIIKDNFKDNEEMPSIYIAKNLGNNAFVINSLLFNFIKELNSITISKDLFNYLNVKELSAIIAHEIGHFKKYIPIAKRIPFITFMFIILVAYISTAFLFPILKIYTFIIYLLCFIIIKVIMTWPFKIFKKDVEFLSDLYSAEKYGKLNTINALIKIYQMNNIDILLNIEITKFVIQSRRLEIGDIEKIKRKIKRKLNKKIFDEILIKDQVASYLKNMKYSNSGKLSEDEIEKRNKALVKYLANISKMLENKIINWDEIDKHVKDGRIDSVEYEGLIDTLKNNPELQLFKTSNDNIRKMRFGTHPALRERILFVDKNCSSLEGATCF
jgi:Zn-dependent protease with chaperone function